MTNKKQQTPSYTQEFKETAIKLAVAGDKPISEVARELGLPEWQLRGWVRAWKKKGSNAGQQSTTSAEERLKQLEKRNKELELEVEILKKAAA